MPTYKVTWVIDIDAKNPRQAATQALEIQRDVFSSAVVFEVENSKGKKVVVDLEVDEE
jgi:hypothetical protein